MCTEQVLEYTNVDSFPLPYVTEAIHYNNRNEMCIFLLVSSSLFLSEVILFILLNSSDRLTYVR